MLKSRNNVEPYVSVIDAYQKRSEGNSAEYREMSGMMQKAQILVNEVLKV